MVISYFQDSHILKYGNRYFNAKSSSFFDRFTANLLPGEKLDIYMRERIVADENQLERLMEVPTDKISFHRLGSFWNPMNWFRIAKKIKEVVIISDFLYLRTEGIYGAIAAVYSQKYHKKYMAIMPADPEQGLKEHGLIGHLISFVHTPLVKRAVKNADYVYYVTQQYLQNKYPTKGQQIGCSDVQLEPLDENIIERRIKKIRKESDKIVIGSAGALNMRIKGQDLVIAAIAELKDRLNIEYRIIGMGDRTEINETIEQFGVEDHVIIEGTIPHNEVFSWLDNIDIFIQPSRTEGLPRALIEAMSRGVPCIGSDVGGIPELLDNTFTFSITDNSIKAIEKLIIELLNKKTQEDQAVRNFELAKNFQKEIVDEKNQKFFKDFDNYARK